MRILLIVFDQGVVIRLLYNQKHNLHEVKEAQVFLRFLICKQDKLHDVFNVVFVRDFLNVLQMGQNFDQFVPDDVGEVLCFLYKVNLQKLHRHVLVDLFQILGDQQLNDKNVFLHVPGSRLILVLEVFLRGGN